MASTSVLANSTAPLLTKLESIKQLSDWQFAQLEAKKLADSIKFNIPEYSILLTQMGRESLNREKLKDAEAYFTELADINPEPLSSNEKFTAFKMLGITAYYQGEYDKSINHYQTALNIAKLRNNPLELANIHNNLGLALLKAHDLESTIRHYVEAHRLYELHGTAQDKADMLLNLSGAYIRQYRYEIAKDMLLRAIRLFNQLNDEYGVALAQANLGVIYSETGQSSLARASLQAAVAYYEKIGSARRLSFEYSNLANLSVALGEMERGYEEAQKALQYAEQVDLDSGRMEALYPLAKLQVYLGDFTAALESIEASIELARAQGSKLREKESLAILAVVQAALGEHKKSLETFSAFQKLQRQLLNDQLVARLNEYQSKIEATELNQEIASLKQQQEVQTLQMEQREQLTWLIILLFITGSVAIVSMYRKRMEHVANIELSQQVAKRTAELQKLADELGEANKVKSQFLANISHEIRTPLTSIIGNSEALLHEYQYDKRIQASLQVIQRQGEHLKGLVSDVLDLSKIEAQRFELEFTEFTLDQLLEDVTDMFQHVCEAKGLNFFVDNQLPSPYAVRLDYVRLKQVLINLLGNAVKFTEFGHVELVVSQKNNGVKFSVNDTGIGMDTVQLQHIFDCFQQGDNSITRRFGGSGLGLCLSQQLATMMGGSIQVKSVPKQGSQFYIVIPCARLEPGFEINNLVNPAQEISQVSQFSGTVLIAEDHDDNRALFERILTQLGVEVITAENGQVALEKALSEFPDMILMDIQMPVLDGLEAFDLLQRAGFDRPIFALTANVMQHEIQSYLTLGFAGHLGKPLNRDKLVQVLSEHLEREAEASEFDIKVDMSDLVASFALSMDQERHKVIELWQKQDWTELKAVCHRLTGAASTFGFEDIAKIAKHIELALKNPKEVDPHGLQHWYLMLCNEMQQIELSEQLNIS
ncbi:tetratricopeptide repeat-containing hybrid sensor histidine kinase/response regulator [Pseudoalteromonas phenolica]|uniref:tetratricopeptide repeat-containing hybrid sensor histidine kinase/response regulator n=1 Tax=Pseudoalteromonas phenolica TaxID=161398 RepID=UPI0014868EC9|nr:ATP-binding protein [Pseudoalteromonas phenolica]